MDFIFGLFRDALGTCRSCTGTSCDTRVLAFFLFLPFLGSRQERGKERYAALSKTATRIIAQSNA